MIDGYEIGVTVTLNDNLFGQIDRMMQAFGQAQQAVDRVSAAVNTLTSNTNGATAAAQALAAVWRDIAGSARSAAGFAGGGGGAGGGAMPMSIGGDGYSAPLLGGPSGNALATIPGQDDPRFQGPQSWGYVPITGYGSGGTPPGGDGGGGAPPNFTMPPDDGGPQGGRDASMGEMYPGRPGRGFSPMHAMSSIFVAQAGYDMVTGAAKALTAPAFDVQQQEINLKNMGASPADIQKALAQAVAIQNNPETKGISLGQAMAMISNLYVVDRNMSAVTAIAPGYSKDAFVASTAQGGADVIDEMYQVLRSGEEAGKLNLLDKNKQLDPSKLVHFMDMVVRMVANSNGNITGAGMLQLAGQAGPGFTQMSDTAIEKAILASQSLGTSQVGTGLNAMYQEFIGGKMSQGTARSLHEAGVLPDYMFGKDGKILKKYRYGIGYAMLPEGALKDEPAALTDPMGWANKDLFGKYLDKDGVVKEGDEKAVETLIANLNRDFSRLPGMRLAGNMLFNTAQYDRQLSYLNNGTVPSIDTMALNDTAGANTAVKGTGSALNSFLQALGSPLIPGATKGLGLLTVALNDASNGLRDHPIRADVLDASLGLAGLAGAGLALKGAGAAFRAAMKTGVKVTVSEAIKDMLGPEVAASMATGAEIGAVGGAETGPGFLVTALIGAIVAGVGTAIGGSPSDYQPGRFGMMADRFRKGVNVPSGAKGDPIYVAPISSGTPWTNQPTSPTGANHAMSAPAPGQAAGHQ